MGEKTEGRWRGLLGKVDVRLGSIERVDRGGREEDVGVGIASYRFCILSFF